MHRGGGRKPRMSKRDVDAQFEAFLNESLSSENSSLDTARVAKFLEPRAKNHEPKPWWMQEGDDDDVGLSGTGKSFLKKTKPETIPEANFEVPVTTKTGSSNIVNGIGDTRVSRDSLDDSLLGGKTPDFIKRSGGPVPALSLGSSYSETTTGDVTGAGVGHGPETLAEIADKKKFFEELEKNSGSTLDWSRLNNDLDKSATLCGTLDSSEKPFLHRPSEDFTENYELREEDEDRHNEIEAKITRFNLAGSSDQDDIDKRQSMLSKVALIDSLDSTLGGKATSQEYKGDDKDMHTIAEASESRINSERRDDTVVSRAERDNSLKTGTGGFGFTNTSREIEALHAALKQVGMSTLGTGDFTLQNSSSAVIASRTEQETVADATQAGTGATGFGLKPLQPSISGKVETFRPERTAEDIIQEVQELRQNGSIDLNYLAFHEEKQERTAEDVIREVKELKRQDTVDSRFSTSDAGESRGFMLSPARQDTGDYVDAYDVSPTDKYGPGGYGTDRTDSLVTARHDPSARPTPAKRKNEKEKEKEKSSAKYSHIRSSGYGQKSSSKPKSVGWSPATTIQNKIKGTEMPKGKTGKLENTDASDPILLASVQSFANYIQDHCTPVIDINEKSIGPDLQWSQDLPTMSNTQRLQQSDREKALVKEVKEWREQWKEERKLHTKYKTEMASVERQCQRKLEEQRITFEEQIFKLKQENYVLQARVAETDTSEVRKRLMEAASSDAVTTDQLERLETEIKEQERLLAGYQTENERLYAEMKKLQKVSRTAEENMFRENDRLRTEVNCLKEQLEQKDMELKTKGFITSHASQQLIAGGNVGGAVLGAGRIAHLEAELKQAKKEEEAAKMTANELQRFNKELEIHVEQLLSKIEQLEKNTKSSQSKEAKDLMVQHEQEVDRLNRKLWWYAENQQLLDRDAQLLKKKDSDIKDLREKVESLSSESGRRQTEMRVKQKERVADAKRIQDLERQVKEMENIIRKRHPNSLPVLMWAASNAPSAESETNKAPSVSFLEQRLQKLESELESKDDEAKLSLRAMEQKFNAMKFQYENRIEELEASLGRYERPGDHNLKEGGHPHTHMAALQKELDSVRERHRTRVGELETEVKRLNKELAQQKAKDLASVKAELKTAKDAEEELKVKLRTLENKISSQEQETHLKQITIERLQKEKQALIIEGKPERGRGKLRAQSQDRMTLKKGTRSRSRPGSAKSQKSNSGQSEADSDVTRGRDLPIYTSTTSTDKTYEPQTFAGHHISDVLMENEQLKIRFERQQLEIEQNRVYQQKQLAELEHVERRLREDMEEQLSALRATHQLELQKLMADHAVHHSTSRVAELQSKLDTLEVIVAQLKQQNAEMKVNSEEFAKLKIRETTLETQVDQLLSNLREAKKTHTPEMRHFEALVEKINKLEERHVHREKELQQIIHQSRTVADAELNTEIQKWQKIVEMKNREIERFRKELDSILDVLKELRRQGVVLPLEKNGTFLR